MFADGTIFQSEWSRINCKKYGFSSNNPEITILNAPDKNIFYPLSKKNNKKNKIRLVASSWSSNFLKGFDIYTYLDQHLNFNKYDFTFIGNSLLNLKY